MKRYTYGTTPEKVIRKNLPDSYNMQLVGDEAGLAQEICNQGIDSHLEAVLLEGRDSHSWSPGKRLHLNVSKDGMICFLRRLLESDHDEAVSLRSGILATIDIEEV